MRRETSKASPLMDLRPPPLTSAAEIQLQGKWDRPAGGAGYDVARSFDAASHWRRRACASRPAPSLRKG